MQVKSTNFQMKYIFFCIVIIFLACALYILHEEEKQVIKVKLCPIKCPLYTVGERLGENRIFGFPQKYHVKTTQDSTQMTFGCQI